MYRPERLHGRCWDRQSKCNAFKYGHIKAVDFSDFLDEGIPGSLCCLENFRPQVQRLGNNLLMRLTRYLYLYFTGAWGVIDDSERNCRKPYSPGQAITLCREERWKELPDCLHGSG